MTRRGPSHQQRLRTRPASRRHPRKVTDGYRAMWAAQGEADVRNVIDTAHLALGANPFNTILATLAA